MKIAKKRRMKKKAQGVYAKEVNTNQSRTITVLPIEAYMKMQSDINDLTATVNALNGVIEELHERNRRLSAECDETIEKYRALMESYHRVQGW